MSSSGIVAVIVTEAGERIAFEGKGKSAHGSLPQDGVNAIADLMEKLAAAGVKSPFVDYFRNAIGFEYNGQRAGVAFEDEQSGKLTLNAGMLRLTETDCELILDIRYPVTIEQAKVTEGLQSIAAPYGLKVELIGQQAPVYMDRNGELITKLVEVYRKETGDNSEPEVIGGGTYARAMDNIVAFGPVIPGRELTEHQKNEYILKEDFLLLRTIYCKALKELAAQ